MARFSRAFTGFAIVALMGSANLAEAQKIRRTEARPIKSVEGRDTFRAYCASCHGLDAKGTGPAAKALAKAPADLTTIAKRHGIFSQADVESFILGQQEIAAHGTREMPIWGPVLQSISTDDSFMKLRVSNLVQYLRSIQTQ